ncbi:MAG TPA: hypothetical protein VGZ32_02560 [Actinocrinis sp.]|jgi:hypothetical protein|uniref:hypothetical protein n=1 Tax=Actinocrinis sp. TaxID=1920516 RepID=UPI002DDD0871|nr:hypothetical protein [Actinocrinis sp.]HEV3169189.1 hypothetical protein [Actinocrinis sp.]
MPDAPTNRTAAEALLRHEHRLQDIAARTDLNALAKRWVVPDENAPAVLVAAFNASL